MRRALLPLLLLAAPALSAQDLRFSPAATEVCVARQEGPEGKRSCLGLSARLCMEATAGGSTTVGMSGCLDRERTYWDQRLNAAYETIQAKAKALDSEMADLGSAAPETAPALRDMQRAWIAYRDATCGFEYSQWGGGTGGGPAGVSCALRLTGAQALYLESAWFGE